LGEVGPALVGVELEVDASGAIRVRGPTLFSGYADEPSPFDADGWLTTNDCGALTSDGRLRVEGRRDNVILSGGENVAAESLEAEIAAQPAIAEACVVGVPDREWGERVVAVVALRKDAADTPIAALEAWAAAHLSGIRRPKTWLLLDALPQLASGKLDRRAIRAHARLSALRPPG
jgi:O-succinylbenzoic acid--CoA ligase